MLANYPLIRYFAYFNLFMIETTMAFVNVIGEAIIVENNRSIENVLI